ncbi:hypothetical protein C4K03_3744 [Pseudomonas synxantha]|uniref:HNH nuclease domain-containing protein n=1 Tax=Pseudomonas synxantha TaxID=47883 RepID=A0A3G7U969_9PSED|nr:hypothetical protein C4K03_3744 [Pseudomonas synxantha]
MAAKILRSCPICSNQITARQLTKNPNKVVCSMACASILRTKKAIERNARSCAGCGTEFSSKPKSKYCSKACMTQSLRPSHTQCRGCGVFFTPVRIHSRNKRYCTAYSAAFVPFCMSDCEGKRKVQEGVSCKSCGVLFTPVRWDRKSLEFYTYPGKTTCGDECNQKAYPFTDERRKAQSARYALSGHPNWQGGSHRGGFRGHGWAAIAEKVREKAGRCCELCGKPEADNGRRLDVNHKIPFHQSQSKEKANKLSNLEALCRSCHQKTDWIWRRDNAVQFSLSFR